MFVFVVFWQRIVITVLSGEAGVYFSRWTGTEINKVYKEGLYVIPPWDVMTRYNIRIQERKHEFGVLSKQGLNISIKISVRFKPDVNFLGVMHQKIGPKYIESVVIPTVESVIRRYFGQFTDDEIYTSKKAILKKILNDSKDQLANKYIILDDLIVRHIKFPAAVEDSIQSKIKEFHKYKEYEYRIEREKLEAKRKAIEAEGIEKYKNIISKNITDKYLKWRGITATVDLAKSDNAKVIVIGSGKNGLPLILNTDDAKKEK